MNRSPWSPSRPGAVAVPWMAVTIAFVSVSSLLFTSPPVDARGAPHSPGTAGTHPRELARSAEGGTGTLPGLRGPLVHPDVQRGYDWSIGWWIYGPGDNSHTLGEGGAFLIDNPTNNLTIFGGLASGGLGNTTIEYNSTPYNWSEWNLPLGYAPTPRANMSSGSDPTLGIGVIFGGITNLTQQRVSNETWVFDFARENWTNATHGPSPSARQSAAMAVDPARNIAILEGGVDPSFRYGSSTGEALWNDTWMLNLSTRTWTQLFLAGAPAPMFGSSMIFDTVDRQFYLFGGCGTTCSSTLWTYRPGDTAWRVVNATGAVIFPRASPAFEWDPTQNATLLFGGFQPGASGPRVLDDTELFDPATRQWATIQFSDQPPPLYDPTVAEPEQNGCAGMFVWSASPSLAGLPVNTWLLESPNPPFPNCFIPKLPNGSHGPPPKCPPTSTELNVTVLDLATGAPVVGASIVYDGPCSPTPGTTDPNGTVRAYVSPGIGWNVTVTRLGYYTKTLWYSAPFAAHAALTIRLQDLPIATIRCWGIGGSTGPVPLPNVTVTLDGSVILGTCDGTGQLGPLRLPFAGGVLTFSGSRSGYSGSNDSVLTPPNANVLANLTLRPSGPLRIEVVRGSDGAPIIGASGVLTSIDPLSVGPVRFSTGHGGWFNVTIGGANFTVSVSAPGLAPVRYGPGYHPWATTTTWLISLGAPSGDNLTVRLIDRSDGSPISGGTVSVAPNFSGTTGADGTVRFSLLGPPGPAVVVGSASGYESRSSLVVLTPSGNLPTLVLALNRTPSCARAPVCALTANATGPLGFHLLPSSGWPLQLLVASPAALLIAATAALMLRRLWPIHRPAGDRPPIQSPGRLG
jgi:hypothetical protein